MKFIGIIPSRYASSRFPGKPLAVIDGKSMIMRVYEQSKKASCFSDVVVATDDRRIFDHVIAEGGKAVMTSNKHLSGTDRVFEAAMEIITDEKALNDHIIINIQGDEPFIDPAAIETLAACFNDPGISIATLIKKISRDEELFDENVVKVISGKSGRALYFSRSALPFVRGKNTSGYLSAFPFYKHIGIYAYRADILREITALKPSGLELAEGLEQLRWLENGYDIFTEETEYESISVDTPEDLLKFTNKD
ncbi:MAG: 3-deoxy-manno-octulosonate cytidylyltransferase [Bacteroidales bacterium]|nr:3-deoxy-manno-octulosonate cytidylyltransferase [Bacteroidales bacterium]